MQSYPASGGSGAVHRFFPLRGVDYYPRVAASELPSLLNQGYDCLILDSGSVAETDLSEFLRCDRKLVLGSLAPWKRWQLEDFFNRFGSAASLGEGFFTLLREGSQGDLNRFAREHHVATRAVPFIQDPLRIEKQHFAFLEELTARRGSGRYITKR